MKRPVGNGGQKPLRRQAPRRNRRRPNYVLLFCVFASVAIVSGTASYLFTTPSLNVSTVDIKGVRLADAKTVERAASQVMGDNILLVRKGPVLNEVRRSSEVKTAKMGRRYPDKLWIRIWEREPDAVLVVNNRFYWIQSDGFVFHCAKSAPAGIIRIDVMGQERPQPGRNMASASVEGALEALHLARSHGIKLVKISVDRGGHICLNMGSDFRVFLGYPEEIARKMAKLKKALARRPSLARDGSYINLSTPSAPAWMPKRAAPTAS